jgi:hypothetical protein
VDSGDELDLSCGVPGLGFFFFEFRVWSKMAEYDASQFHPRSLKCVLSLDDKQSLAICALYSLSRKTKVEQHPAIVDHFFNTPNLKSEKSQKAQSDNNNKFNTLLDHAQQKIEAQIA